LGIAANKIEHIKLKQELEDILVQLSTRDHEKEVARIARDALLKMAKTRLLRISPSRHKKRTLPYLL